MCWHLVALCPKCLEEDKNVAMKQWQVRCGVIRNIGGIWIYCYCPRCGITFCIDWATGRGLKDAWGEPVRDEVSMDLLSEIKEEK